MFKEMLKKQSTIVHSLEDAERYSPFRLWFNDKSQRYVVLRKGGDKLTPVAAGMDREEAEACLLFKANEHVFREMQKPFQNS